MGSSGDETPRAQRLGIPANVCLKVRHQARSVEARRHLVTRAAPTIAFGIGLANGSVRGCAAAEKREDRSDAKNNREGVQSGARTGGNGRRGGTMNGAYAQDTIKVGSSLPFGNDGDLRETTLKDVMLMLIEEQNKKGGLLGRKLRSGRGRPGLENWPLFAEKARRDTITKDKVAATFGSWTSVSLEVGSAGREGAQPRLLLPGAIRGRESERNVFYTGTAPNQQAIPAVDYLAGEEKRGSTLGARRDGLRLSTHTNKILEAYLKSQGREVRGHHDPITRHSDIPTGRRSSPTSKGSARRGRRPRWSRPSRGVRTLAASTRTPAAAR